jgi:hypothetical protein
MEITRSFDGGLNTDDAPEVIPQGDFTSAVNLVSSKAANGRFGARELVRGTTLLSNDVNLLIENFTNDLNGWENKIGAAGSASIELLSEGVLTNRTTVIGSGDIVITGSAVPVTYDSIVRARMEASVSVNSVKFMYRRGGSGSYTVLKTTTVGVQPSYSLIETVQDTPKGQLLEIYLLRATDDVPIVFGTGNGGGYTGFGGSGNPYQVNINNANDLYINIRVLSNQFVPV